MHKRDNAYPRVAGSMSSNDNNIWTQGIFRFTTISSSPSTIGSQYSSFLREKKPFSWNYFRERKKKKTHVLKHSRVIWCSGKSRFKISAHEIALPTPPPYPVHTMVRCSPDCSAFLANSVTFGTAVPPFTCIHRKSSGKFSIFMSFLVNSSSTFRPFL